VDVGERPSRTSGAAATGTASGTEGDLAGFAGFLLAAGAMFATMYSTQAILPELSRAFAVTPSTAGLTISAVVIAIALGAWLWGPLSDRVGRVAAMRLSSGLLVMPTLVVALAPSFEVLLAARVAQGLCMPGLLVVGAPYVVEALIPRVGARAMGWYVGALVLGGLVGRVGVALATGVVGWRIACAALTALPLAAVLAMRDLSPAPAPARTERPWHRVVTLRLTAVTAVACALFAAFVGTFTFVTYRLEGPPFRLSVETAGLVFLLWLVGLFGPMLGRLTERAGWRVVAGGAVALAAVGVLATLPDRLATIVPGLALVAVAMFAGYGATQLGVGDVAREDRGAASAFMFSVYYASGALAAYVPGLAWERWGWNGVAGFCAVALGVAVLALLALARLESAAVDGGAGPPYALGP
jgi:YNFM family putative membrane transporter